MSHTVTLIIHGTFASDEDWWRLGKDSASTFANRLEASLAQRGLANTVWLPALNQGLTYESFAWTGNNLHHDRLIGAKKMFSSLKTLAKKIEATQEKPLVVNFVAHSHGGNVVLEVLKQLGDTIRAGKVVLLGTPLISMRPALRLCRLLIAYILLTLLMIVGFYFLIQLGYLAFTGNFYDSEGYEGWYLSLIILPAMIFYGWMFWFFAYLGDLAWRFIYSPLKWLRGQFSGQVYGPAPGSLAKKLEKHFLYLFTSHGDEADLILHLTSAPRSLYIEHIETKWGSIARWIDRIFLRPIVVGLFLRVLEVFFEHFALGFSWLQVLLFDYEMADLDKGKAYPSSIIKRVDITKDISLPDVRTNMTSLFQSAIKGQPSGQTTGLERRVTSLRETIQAVGENIMHQIRLRHSLYYQNDIVLNRIADIIMEDRKS